MILSHAKKGGQPLLSACGDDISQTSFSILLFVKMFLVSVPLILTTASASHQV